MVLYDVGTYVLFPIRERGKEDGPMERDGILRQPENQRFFVWTASGLKLVGNPPPEVVDAWLTLADLPKKKPWLAFMHKAHLQ